MRFAIYGGKEGFMKSAVFYGKHDLRVEDSPMPDLGPNDVLVCVKACGVCGTDVHIFEGDEGAADCTPPAILGHEFSGVVEAAGSGVKNISPGDRVCIDPNRYCGECYYCVNGLAHYCENMVGYGTTENGAFAQFCRVDAKQVYLLGENTSFEQGAMTEPVACCLHGVDICGIVPGSNVVVIGGGMIGLIVMQLARISGAVRLVMIEPVEEKRRMAKELGADICIDPFNEDAKAVLNEHGIHRVNTVIECVGLTSAIEQAVSLAGNKSVVMMYGLTKPDDEIRIKPFEFFRKEIELKASFINPYTQKRALDLIDSGRLDVTSMLLPPCGLEELGGILSSPEMRAKGKYIIDPWK